MLTDRATSTLKKRIFKKDKEGKSIEDFPGLCERVSNFLGKDQAERECFFSIIKEMEFLPNSPCLVNAGIEGRQNQLSACFVLTVDDSIDSIFDMVKEAAIIHKTGGGTGFDFSRIRPKDSVVMSTAGVASGPVSFMHVFDSATEAIKQGGVRRGANMGVLRIDHPDILDFVNAKRGKDALKNFNISVAITDEFMRALYYNEDYSCIDPRSGKITKKSAKQVWDTLVENAWSTADPGILFIDRIQENNPLTNDESRICATNPCGEQPLAPNEACGLGSLNLTKFVNHDGSINFETLGLITKCAVLFLNRMLDKSDYPNEKIATRVKASRKIGLGIMGLADMLILMKVSYDSPEALEIVEDVIKCVLDNAVMATHEIGQKEGVFPMFEHYHPPKHIRESLQRLGIRLEDYTPRNSALLTVAPTGTLSMVANVSSGIEPVFYFEQVERRMDTEIIHCHPVYEAFKSKYPKIKLPNYFKQMEDIDIATHIKMQATVQQYICSGVSKTVNLPADATKHDVEQAFKEAFMLGCKGITIYRDGCLDNQVISRVGAQNPIFVYPEDRPKHLNGTTFAIKTGYGQMLVTLNYKDGLPFEVICQLGKSGGSEAAKAESVGRLVSTMLRCKIPTSVIVEQLEGIVGSESVFTEYGLVKSIPDALAKILIRHALEDNNSAPKISIMRKCKDCGHSPLNVEGSCLTCPNCGWKSCGG